MSVQRPSRSYQLQGFRTKLEFTTPNVFLYLTRLGSLFLQRIYTTNDLAVADLGTCDTCRFSGPHVSIVHLLPGSQILTSKATAGKQVTSSHISRAWVFRQLIIQSWSILDNRSRWITGNLTSFRNVMIRLKIAKMHMFGIENYKSWNMFHRLYRGRR